MINLTAQYTTNVFNRYNLSLNCPVRFLHHIVNNVFRHFYRRDGKRSLQDLGIWKTKQKKEKKKKKKRTRRPNKTMKTKYSG